MIRKITESRWIGPALAFLGILLMILGICRGEVSVVFTKAINNLYGVYRHWIIRR